jgi:hypothetical protein
MRPLVTVLRLLPLAAAALASVATSAPPLPEPDTCSSPPAELSLDLLEIGPGDDGNSAFVPFVDGDEIPIVVGGQGSDMIVLRIRIAGEDAPACLPQTTRVLSGGVQVAGETRPLTTVDAGDGTRVTPPIYMILGSGGGYFDDGYDVAVTVADRTVQVHLGGTPEIDAGPDASPDAAADASLDAAPDASLDAAPDASLDAAPDAS